MENSTVLLRIGILGIFVGFRAFMPLAMLSFFVWRQMLPMPPSLRVMGHMWVFVVLAVLASLEVFADKWRGMPNRTSPMGLVPRVAIGGFCGFLLAVSTYISVWKGAGVCALLAVLGASLGYSLRQYFREATRTQDFYIAVIEDFVTFLGSWWVLSHLD
jgi:uncharacterized membrane protein